jgi:hypothetical protein
MTHWRKLSNRELVREELQRIVDDLETFGADDQARAIREAMRRLMLPKSRREKPQERTPHRRRVA